MSVALKRRDMPAPHCEDASCRPIQEPQPALAELIDPAKVAALITPVSVTDGSRDQRDFARSPTEYALEPAGRPSLIHREDALVTVPMDVRARSGAAPRESFARGGVTQVVDQVLTVIEGSRERLEFAARSDSVLVRESPVV